MKKIDLFAVLSLLCLSYLFWGYIPELEIQGEGFQYFEPAIAKIYIRWPLSHDMLAKLLFNFLPTLFGSTIRFYMWFLLGFMLVVNVLVYFVARTIFQSKLMGFLTGLLFSTSYVGQYDAYSSGGYQYFAQRNTILLPMLAAFVFVVLHLRHKFSLRCYLLSLTIFLTGIAMGFFGTWFMPVFIFYSLFYLIFNLRKAGAKFTRIALVPIPFLLGNFLVIRQSSFALQEESIVEFIINKFLYVLTGTLQQLVVLSFSTKSLLDVLLSKSNYYTSLFLTFVIYFVAFVIIYKRRPAWRVLAATSICSLLAMLLFNLYLNAATVLNTLGSSRYFYFPFTMVALFWAMFLGAIFAKKKSFNMLPLSIVCVAWLVFNFQEIRRNFVLDEWKHKANRDTLANLEKWKEDLILHPSYVVLPSSLGADGTGFAFRFYSHPSGKFTLESLEAYDPSVARTFNPERVYVLHYDAAAQYVVNQTDQVREALLESRHQE